MSETKESFTIYHGDCLEVLRSLPDCSVDSVVSDPPYGLSFMGKKWDYDVPAVEVWQECLRVLKPGGHLLAFAGTRTQHRMAVRIEDAGFEIRDMIAWVYGSGFPKSLDVSKAIDKAAGAKRETKRVRYSPQQLNCKDGQNERPWMKAAAEAGFHELPGDEPVTDAARQWQGWGTALKPALEPITLARKPLEGTVAENVLKWHTGAVNVDKCRVAIPASDKKNYDANMACHERYADGRERIGAYEGGWKANQEAIKNTGARWPANLIHDGSEEVTKLFPVTTSGALNAGHKRGSGKTSYDGGGGTVQRDYGGDSGSAARFFKCCPSDSEPSRFAYVPKASKKDRDEGIESCVIANRQGNRPGSPDETGKFPDHDHRERTGNFHPTVKPTDLMRYLCRLVTCPGGVVLDPFTGSGSTGKAAVLEGFRFIGIEREAEYVQIARARISAVQQEKPEPDLLLI